MIRTMPFNDEEEHVHAGRGLNALYVDSRVHGDEDENPDPARDLRDEALAPVADKDVQQAGNKNIVEQDEPPGEEATCGFTPRCTYEYTLPAMGKRFAIWT